MASTKRYAVLRHKLQQFLTRSASRDDCVLPSKVCIVEDRATRVDIRSKGRSKSSRTSISLFQSTKVLVGPKARRISYLQCNTRCCK